MFGMIASKLDNLCWQFFLALTLGDFSFQMARCTYDSCPRSQISCKGHTSANHGARANVQPLDNCRTRANEGTVFNHDRSAQC